MLEWTETADVLITNSCRIHAERACHLTTEHKKLQPQPCSSA